MDTSELLAEKAAILDSSWDAILVVDGNARITEANHSAQRMLGRPRDALIGKDFIDLVLAPHRRTSGRNAIQRLNEGASEWFGRRVPTEAVRANGDVFPAELTIAAVAVRGEPRYATFLRDVSDQVAADRALRESEGTFRSLTENTPSCICVIRDGRILYVNPAMVKLLGYPSAAELMTQPISALAHPDERGRSDARAQEVLESGQPVTFEARRALRRDGKVVHVEVAALKIDFRGGPAVMTISRDVTERMAAEAHAAELQTRLALTERMAAMGQLVGAVAHEVRNPLFAISATLDAFEERFGKRPDELPYLKVFREEIGRLTQLMTDLLDYGRPPLLNFAAHRAVDIVKAALNRCAPIATQAGVTLRDPVGDAALSLTADRDRLTQVVHNLVLNSVQLSPRGSEVRVEVSSHARSGVPGLVVDVQDRGPGFAPEDLAHVFEPFFSRRQSGVGLGLSIVEKIVSQHGGTVTPSNREGGGADVKVWLPLAQPTEPPLPTR